MERVAVTITGLSPMLGELGQRKAVLLPLEEYEALLERVEELEDILDSERSVAAYRAGEGKSLEQYLAERKGR